MSRRFKNITLLSVVAALLVTGLLVAGFMWRLSQGPVSLTFLTGRVKQMMDANLSGMRAEIGDVVIERDSESGAPRFRLREIRLRDLAGNIIAKAPRAAVDVGGWALLSGRLKPVAFELIGPRITVRRQLDGTIQLGFGRSPEDGSPDAQDVLAMAGEKSDRSDVTLSAPPGSIEENPVPAFATRSVIDYLNRELLSDNGRSSAISSLKSLRVSEASISLYDEANDAWWHAPKTNLVFRRVPYGFAVFADASIASGGNPWRTEFVASYKAEARAFTVTARIFDLVPADIADDVFALSRLAQVRLPLSGHAEIEFSDRGITKASAELSAAAGRVGFPDYISEPVIIDEGVLKLDYEPKTEAIVIGDSAVFIGGTPTQLQGRIEPLRSGSGKLTAVRFDLRTRTVSIGGAGQNSKPLALDRVEVRGVAALNEARFDLEDLIVMSGSSGLRARGRFVGSGGGVGVFVDGQARDLPAGLVKKLWPPIVAAGAREWIFENVIDAKIPDATFRVAIPSETVAAALQGQNIPDEMVDLSFTLTDVATRYFEDLPPLRGALGTARLTGDNFRLELKDGLVLLPSGKEVYFRHGVMTTTELAAKLSPTTFRVYGAADAPALLELIDQEPLRLVTEAGFDAAKIDGEATVDLTIDVPLARKIPDNSVRVAAKAQLDKAIIRDVIDGLSIEDAQLAIEVDESAVRASGPVRLNGTAATITWTRPIGTAGPVESGIAVEAELAEADLKRLGSHVPEIIRGPVKVKATAKESGGRISTAHVEADLTRAELRLDSLGWARPAGEKSTAEFDVEFPTSGGIALSNLAVAGGGLKIAGGIRLDGKGDLVEASFPTLTLDERNDLSVKLQSQGNGVKVSVAGRSFDARPLIGKLFSPSAGSESGKGVPMRIDVGVERLHANRGEIFSGLSGTLQLTDGAVQSADLSGSFVNGEPISLKVTPTASGQRELSLASRDGGATLRAVDLYSKIAGGTFDLRATLAPASKGGVQRGLLVIRNFEVRNEAVISDIEQRTPGKHRGPNGPRREGQIFSKLSLPFAMDEKYIRIGDALVQGPDVGASAQGHIRKADGGMDIGGTIIPAYALNAALGDVPVLGQLLTGGKGEGVFGLNYALRGTVEHPKFLINPVSAIAPGILRRLFDIGGGADPDAAPPPRRPQRELYR